MPHEPRPLTRDDPVYASYKCPRCRGAGGDPVLEPRQSCLICWGEGTVPAWREGWDGQHGTLVREFLHQYGTPIITDEEDAE